MTGDGTLTTEVRDYVLHLKRTEAHRSAIQTMEAQQKRLDSDLIQRRNALARREAFELAVAGVRVVGGGGQCPAVFE